MLIPEVEHNRWKAALYDYLDDSSGRIVAPPDECNCRFGRWYASPASQRYGHFEAFTALGGIHRRIHQIGSEMVALHQQGESAAIARLKQELEGCSRGLSQSIRQMQAELLISP